MSESKPSVSFSFNSKRKPDVGKLSQSILVDGKNETIQETDFIKSVQDNKIHGTVKAPEKKELVIPLISRNRWRHPETRSNPDIKQEKLEDSELDKQAANEIIEETLKAVDSWEQRNNGVPSNIAIPLFMQNRVPSGFETDEKVDVSLRAEQSTLDDYEAIPVEAYGMAMLRGMGWKSNEGIGLTRKGIAPIVKVDVRPKGLGLGADRSKLAIGNAAETKTETKEAEKLKLVVGAYVQLLGGKNQGSYGQVLSMDGNTGRALIKMAVGNNEIEMSELFLKPVSAKEYRDSSRVLNKEKYDEYKMKQENERKEKERNDLDRDSRKRRKHSPSRGDYRDRSRSRERRDKHEKNKESRSKKHSKDSKESVVKKEPWLHPYLRVRCIDSHFKDGQYYKQKMVVLDVVSKNHCTCKDESGKLLENISISKLETVIPRGDPAYVMVVRGKRKGQVCEVLERDKERCLATVQILPDRDDVFKIDYDDICEFTGDVRNL